MKRATSGADSRKPGVRAWLLAGGGAALVLVLTTFPTSSTYEIPFWCLTCGDRGTADAVLNVLLFVPFGAGASLVLGGWAAVAASAALSGSVELIQEMLPGRYPTLGDLVFNTAGGGLGALIVFRGRSLVQSYVRSRWAFAGAAGLGLAVVAAPAVLFAPAPPDTVYFGQWTPDLGHMARYDGTVLSASIGDRAVPVGRTDESIRDGLRERRTVRVDFVTGAPPMELAPVFAIHDEGRREVVLVGASGTAVVYRHWTLAAALQLESPSHRWPGALPTRPGDTVTVWAGAEGGRSCLRVGGRSRCDLAPGPAEGWRLLLGDSFSALAQVLSLGWMAALALPLGYWLGRDRLLRAAAAGTCLAAAGVVVALLSPDLSSDVVGLAGAPVGALVGARLRGRIWGPVGGRGRGRR